MRDNDDITREIMEAGFASALARGASTVGSLAAHATGIPRLARRGMGTVQSAKAYNQIRADWNRWAGTQGGLRGVATTPDNLYQFAHDIYGLEQDTVRPYLEPLIREYIGSVDVDDLDDEPAPAPTFGKRTTPPGQQPAAARPASGIPPNPPAAAGAAAPAARTAAAPEAPASAADGSASAPAAPEASPRAPEAPSSPAAPAAAPEAPTAAAARATPSEEPPARSFGKRPTQTQGPARTASGRVVPADRITRIDPATGKPLYRHNSNGVNFDDPTLNDPETTTKSSKQTSQARRDATRREKTRQLSNDVAAKRPRTESVINPIGKSFSQIIAEAPSTVSLRDIEKGRAKATDARNKEVFRQRDAAAKAEKGEIARNDAAIRKNVQSLGDEFFKVLARKVTANPQNYRAFMGKTGQDYTGHSTYGSPSKLGMGAPTSAAQTQAQSQGNINRATVNSILTRQFGMKPEALAQVRDAIADMSPKQAEQWIMSHQNNRLAAQVLVALLKATQAR